MCTSCVLLSFLSSPPIKSAPPHPTPQRKRKQLRVIFETDYTTELHRYCSLDSSINSLYMHFYFAVQNCFYDHMSFLWC